VCGFVVLALVAGVALTVILRAPLPQYDGTITLAGPTDEVAVSRDGQGVPHIYASSDHALLIVSIWLPHEVTHRLKAHPLTAHIEHDSEAAGDTGRGGIGGEIHSAGCDCPRQDLGETGLVERGLALRQLGNPVLVHVESYDVVADLRHAGRVHRPQVAATDHCNPHALKGSG